MELRITLQPKQKDAYLHRMRGRTPYLMYGGAKGGGKSYFIRASEVSRRMTFAGTTGVIFRRTFPELMANHIRKFWVEYPWTKEWYKASEKAIYYPNGSITEFKYLKNTNDVYNYQGIEYDDITIDEATQHEEEIFKILKTSLRSDPKVMARNPNYRPSLLLTGNPGGIGHGWVKRLFIDRSFESNENPQDYAFIGAKIWDNPIFISVNPDYLRNLEELPPDLRRAYLEGDWDIFIGQFFQDFRRDVHVVEPFTIDDQWPKIYAIDWGYSPHPYHVGWYTKNWNGQVFKYRELAGTETPPDELARKVAALSREDQNLQFGVGDTQMWAQNPFQKPSAGEVYTDKSIAEMMNSIFRKHNLYMYKANKDRVTGWALVRSMFKWEAEHDEQTGERYFIRRPTYYIFKTCETTVASYPNMIHSELKPEDMEKIDGDDPIDTDRYALMAIRDGLKREEKPKTHMAKLMQQAKRRQRQNQFNA